MTQRSDVGPVEPALKYLFIIRKRSTFRMDIDKTITQRLAEAKSLHVGGSPTNSMATLCIYADDLDPEHVTATVKCLPTKARRKGECYPDRPKIPAAPLGQWFLEAPDDLSFIDKIQFLLNSSTDVENEWQTLAESHSLQLHGAVFLESWTEGFELSNDMLAEIARRKWSFSLSMYSAEGEEILNAFLSRSKHDNDTNG